MRELRLVGISEDRRHVVLRDADTDEEFRVAADESLRAALRDDRAGLGQLEATMDSALRPRDIQARIRAGASPEEVAEVAQLPLERVMGYAVPVLAEREHIVDRARAASVRRKHREGPTRTLGDTVSAQLGPAAKDARWDSWRREDGRWVVCVAPGADDEVAHYVFDPPGRYALADDDAARRLIGDEPPAEDPSTMAVATAVQAPVDAPVPVDPPDWTAQQHAGSTPSGQPATESPDEAPDELADEAPDAASPAAVTRLRRRRTLHQVPDPLPLEEIGSTGPESGADSDAPVAPPAEPRRRRDRRRASVPSWDEIMFGGKSE